MQAIYWNCKKILETLSILFEFNYNTKVKVY